MTTPDTPDTTPPTTAEPAGLEQPGHSIGLTPPAPPARRIAIPTWALATAAALIVAAIAAASTWALTRGGNNAADAGAATEAVATPSDTTRTPAPKPGGSRGSEWHQFYRYEPWEIHVKSVDDIGLLLIIQTDLRTRPADLAQAVEICEAGREHLGRLGVAARASVSVYSSTNVEIAQSSTGRACVN